MLTCGWCFEQVIPTRNINWFLLVALLFFGVLGGLVYLAVWIGKAATICPLCEGDVYGRAEVVSDYSGRMFVFGHGWHNINSPNLEEEFDTESKLRIARARRRRRPVASPGVESG